MQPSFLKYLISLIIYSLQLEHSFYSCGILKLKKNKQKKKRKQNNKNKKSNHWSTIHIPLSKVLIIILFNFSSTLCTATVFECLVFLHPHSNSKLSNRSDELWHQKIVIPLVIQHLQLWNLRKTSWVPVYYFLQLVFERPIHYWDTIQSGPHLYLIIQS